MTQKMEGEELADMLAGSYMFEERYWAESEVSYELTAVKRMDDGSKAYEIKVVKASGSESFMYYDTETGLKVRESEFLEGPEGPIAQSTDYLDYTDEHGLMLPGKIIIPLGPQRLEAELKSADVNAGLKVSDFTIE